MCAATPAPSLGSGHLELWDSPLSPAAFWPCLAPSPVQTEPGAGSPMAGVLLEPAISHKANCTISWVKIPQHNIRVLWGDGDRDKVAHLRSACSLGSGGKNLILACSSQEQAGVLRGTSVWLLIWPHVPAWFGSQTVAMHCRCGLSSAEQKGRIAPLLMHRRTLLAFAARAGCWLLVGLVLIRTALVCAGAQGCSSPGAGLCTSPC